MNKLCIKIFGKEIFSIKYVIIKLLHTDYLMKNIDYEIYYNMELYLNYLFKKCHLINNNSPNSLNRKYMLQMPPNVLLIIVRLMKETNIFEHITDLVYSYEKIVFLEFINKISKQYDEYNSLIESHAKHRYSTNSEDSR